VCTALSVAAAAVGILAADAEAATPTKLQAEHFQLRGGAKRVRGGRAAVLAGRGYLRRRIELPALSRLTLRARGSRCGGWPRVGVFANGRRIGRIAVRSRHWRRYSKGIDLAGAKRTIVLRLLNRRRGRACTRRAVVDWLALLPRPPAPSQTAGPAPITARQPAPAVARATFRNPVLGQVADPMVLDRGASHSSYVVYATGGGFPMAKSSDLVHWSDAGPAMPARPGWAQQTGDYNPWAPSVLERPQACPGSAAGPCFLMFYGSKHASLDPPANCIGVATSPVPTGPFADRGPLQDGAGSLDQSGRPIGCGDDGGYSNIDPAPFVDAGGAAYLYLSTGHRCPAPAPHAACAWDRTISVIPLSADRLRAAGPRTPLFASGAAWESAVVENPWMRRRNGVYELFYSGGIYSGAYGMGYATGPSPTGPFAKAAGNPVLRDSAEVKSAGGGSLVTGPGGGTWVAYHGRALSYTAVRDLRIDPVRTAPDGSVRIDGPTIKSQPVP
jgi:Glycosyl hydrolases family 43